MNHAEAVVQVMAVAYFVLLFFVSGEHGPSQQWQREILQELKWIRQELQKVNGSLPK